MPSSTMWPFESDSRLSHVIAGKALSEWALLWCGESISRQPSAWISKYDIEALNQSTNAILVDDEQNELARTGNAENTISAQDSFLIKYPWHLLNVSEQIIGNIDSDHIEGNIHPNSVIDGNIQLGENSRILPGVYIEGNAVIGANCKIGPNCYIRGNTSIGNNVHIGNAVEVKNSIIGNDSAVGHLSYVGDSIIGDKVNFGAGTITSNFRHDGSNHRSQVNGELVDTGRRKFGAAIGNAVHTGIQTSIYPGRKIETNCSTLPGAIVTEDLFH